MRALFRRRASKPGGAVEDLRAAPLTAPDPTAVAAAANLPLAAAQAFGQIAGEVLHRHIRQGRRGLVICGASTGSGVTFTAANLAIAVAQSGVSTLLVDANLRDPGLDTVLRPPKDTPGLQQLLRGEAERVDVVQEGVLDGLSVVYAGGAADDADRLLAGERCRESLSPFLRDYDCTIIDTPPANRYADVRAIAAIVGYALIVGRRGFSFLDDMALLSHQLQDDGVSVIGSVLNGA